MKIRILRNCAIGGQHREAGTIVEVDKQTAVALVTLHRAEIADDTEARPARVEQREPQVETRDPEITTTKRKAKANG
jgi:hypothetical protein